MLDPSFKFQRGKTKSKIEPHGLLTVDTFTKFCWVVPTHFKDKENIDVAIHEVFKKMAIYSDPDSGFHGSAAGSFQKQRRRTHHL